MHMYILSTLFSDMCMFSHADNIDNMFLLLVSLGMKQCL